MKQRILIIAIAAFAAAGAIAQPKPSAGNDTQAGFFKPQPDPSLQRPNGPQPAAAAAQGNPAQPASAAPGNVPVPDMAEEVRKAEEQMDRSRQEAELARQQMNQSPPRINGAFTGSTSERDR